MLLQINQERLVKSRICSLKVSAESFFCTNMNPLLLYSTDIPAYAHRDCTCFINESRATRVQQYGCDDCCTKNLPVFQRPDRFRPALCSGQQPLLWLLLSDPQPSAVAKLLPKNTNPRMHRRVHHACYTNASLSCCAGLLLLLWVVSAVLELWSLEPRLLSS